MAFSISSARSTLSLLCEYNNVVVVEGEVARQGYAFVGTMLVTEAGGTADMKTLR